MAGDRRAPIHIDHDAITFLGWEVRTILCMGGGVVVGALLALSLGQLPLEVRIGAFGFFVMMGVALAWGRIGDQQLTVEAWLLDLWRFRNSTRVWRKRVAKEDTREIRWAPKPKPQHRHSVFGGIRPQIAAPRLEVHVPALPRPSFWLLTANALGVAALLWLGVWLLNGGVERISWLVGGL